MMRKFIDLIAVVLFAVPVFAISAKKIGVEGYVTSFDKDKIIIESGNQNIEVPRKFYSYQVKTGEKIVVEMDEKDFEGLKKADAKKNTKKK